MLRMNRGAATTAVAIVAGATLGTAAVVFSAVVLDGRLIATQTAGAAPLQSQLQAQMQDTGLTINRDRKGDALPVSNAPQTRAEIKSVEVVGVRGASIVYRDRDGNILFRTDPLSNVTIVTKNVDLPEVTIREAKSTEVKRVPAEDSESATPPNGCESAFARPSPESLTRKSSRCVTHVPANPANRIAALQ